ncbi:MAG TPA: undecaprenyl-diphosphate phosphatase [Candidatus Micrarchaeota archaeon]|nr:undecaprenyl-diphosphate phosphatase [Candidatus Micrarchaeota archaeon]
MDIIQLLILGIVQGITEWIPISSKTQLAVVYLGVFKQDPAFLLSMVLFAHIGTLLAATVYFRKEIAGLAKKFLEKPLEKETYAKGETGFIFGAILMTGVVGVPIIIAESVLYQDLNGMIIYLLLGGGLIFTGLLLHSQKNAKQREIKSAGLLDGIVTGALQGLSTIPGVSRSGTSTTGLIWRGFDAESSFHLSFLLSVPTVIIAEMILYSCGLGAGPVSFVSNALAGSGIPFIAGLGAKVAAKCAGTMIMALPEALLLALTSFVVGYLTIGFILKSMKKVNLAYVAIAWGILVIVFGVLGAS